MNIIKHGAGGVGSVGGVNASFGKPPKQPGIHGAERQLSVACFLPGAGYRIQYPLEFTGGKIGINHQAGLFLNRFGKPLLFKLFTEICGSAILPDNSVAQRIAGGAIPHQRCFPLVGNADSGDVFGIHAAFVHGFHHDMK